MADQAGLESIRKNAGATIALGVILLIIGIIAIGAPLLTGVAVTYLIGMLFLAGGIFQVAFCFRAGSWGAGLLGFAGGLLAVIAGLLVIAHPLFGLSFLTLLLAAYFLVDGISSIALASRMRPARGSGWTLFGGVVSVLLALLIWMQWPVAGTWAIGLLVGIKMIFTGWAMIALGGAARNMTAPGTAEPAV